MWVNADVVQKSEYATKTYNESFQKIFLTNTDGSEIFVVIKVEEILQASWEDNTFTLYITYRGNIDKTIHFGDINEKEYKRIKLLFV